MPNIRARAYIVAPLVKIFSFFPKFFSLPPGRDARSRASLAWLARPRLIYSPFPLLIPQGLFRAAPRGGRPFRKSLFGAFFVCSLLNNLSFAQPFVRHSPRWPSPGFDARAVFAKNPGPWGEAAYLSGTFATRANKGRNLAIKLISRPEAPGGARAAPLGPPSPFPHAGGHIISFS